MLAGLLVLFGGVLPLLRRIGANPASIAWQTAASSGLDSRDMANTGLQGKTEPAIASLSGAQQTLVVDAETVRSLVANDPERTAQIIKEWIARDRSNVRRAS
jgi:flagellar biosynthesis/type III secretory pathway M-ring protein FliF/YscJ